MEATMGQTTRQNRSPGLLLLLVLVVTAFVLAAISYGKHASSGHSMAAPQVRDCIQRNGALETWMNPDNDRLALICKISDGKFGIQIRKGNREITSFIKNQTPRIEQVYKYLLNRGYKFVRLGGR